MCVLPLGVHVVITLGRRQSNMHLTIEERGLKIIRNIAISICPQPGNKWQSKTLFLTIFYLHLSIVLTFLIAAYPVW